MLRPASLAPRSPRHAGPSRVAALALALLLPLLGACEDLGPDRSRLLIRFEERPPLGRDRLVVTVRDDVRQYYLEGLDLQQAPDGWWEARELRLSNAGEAEVLVALRGVGAAPAAAVTFPLPLSPNARWQLDVFASNVETAAACGDCAGFRKITLAPQFRPSPQDWLYVTWTMRAP